MSQLSREVLSRERVQKDSVADQLGSPDRTVVNTGWWWLVCRLPAQVLVVYAVRCVDSDMQYVQFRIHAGVRWQHLLPYVFRFSHSYVTLSLCIVYVEWQWRNFFIPIYASCSGWRDVGQGNVNILQHLQSDRRSGAST